MKKLVTFALSAACVCGLALGIAACGDDNDNAHTHKLMKVDAASATFFENGNSEYYTCDCGKYFSDSEGKNEIRKDSWVIAAVGTTADAFDAFTVYNSASTKGSKGIVCGLDTGANAGPATYFGEEDKNLEWDGGKTTIGFMLDLSALEENDFTIWVLSFNKQEEGEYVHSGTHELRIGIAKTETGFVANMLAGVGFDETADLAQIVSGGKAFTEDDIAVTFEMSYDKSDSNMTYTLTVAGQEFSGSTVFEAQLTGFRSLWNAYLNKDGVEAYNFTRV